MNSRSFAVSAMAFAITCTIAVFAVPALAIDEHHVTPSNESQSTAKTPPPDVPAARDTHTMQMQTSMKKMQEQMEKFQKTSDPKERMKLAGEHMQAMMESMQSMCGVAVPMMMSGGPRDSMTGADAKPRQDMIERRMDMMQVMMEQMMQHHQMMHPGPAK